MSEDNSSALRGFTLSHQRNVLDIDFSGIITASAFLTVQPTNPSLRTLYLHASPLLQINNVTLSSPTSLDPLLPTPASFSLSNPFQSLPARDPPIDIKSHPEIKRRTWAAMGERDEGELAVSVSGGWVRLVETQMPGGQGGSHVTFAPIQVQIDYQLVLGGDVVEGIVFRRPGDGGDEYQIPHMYLSPTDYDAARVWTPCVDSLWERCTWELEYIVPRYLEGGQPGPGEEAYPVTVVSSGELMEQVTHPHDPHKVIFYYLQTNPTSIQHISFAAGPFEMHCASAEESHRPILTFCLPGDLDMVKHSTSWLPKAMAFYTEMGSYPFTDFKVVFVNTPRTQIATSATLAIVSSDLLHPPSVIEQGMEIRQVLSLALIQQWVGVNIIQRTLADTWLVNGLALYIQAQFIRHLLGNNEYRFRLKKDIDRCVQQDQGSQWPLCVPGTIDPPDALTTAFINLKAPLVLHMLDRHLAKTGISLGLSQVIPRIFVASLSDELVGNTVSTQYFFRQCRKISGLDLQTFQDQWIFGSGCPRLIIRTNFVKKKFVVEFGVTQVQPAHQCLQGMSEKQKKAAAWKRPSHFFEGSLTVRIHEADGAPFEHLVDVKTNQRTFPLPFNTKYKRTRRSGQVAARFNKMQDALAAGDANDEEDEARLQAADRAGVFAYPPWEDEEERRRWRVAEWGEEQADQMMGEGGGYEWIRVDPECEWLAAIEFAEKPWCWVSQLQGDRDVIAQLEAINHMRVYPTPVIASELARTVLVKNYYFRVRMEAARALAAYNLSECDYIGYYLVLKLFQTFFCESPSDRDAEASEMDLRPLPNDFTNLADYFVKKSLIAAMADLRDPATRTVWRNVRVALLDILKLNDNTANEWSDSYYLAAVITAIGNAFTMGAGNQAMLNDEERESEASLSRDAMDALDRSMTMDRLVPSYHNLITKAGLQTYIKAVMAGQRTNDPRVLLSYTREGNFEPVRMVAFDGLLLCKPPGRSNALDRYFVDVIKSDHSLTIRRHVARGLSESILMSLALGEVTGAIPPPAVVDVTEETDEAREKRLDAQNNTIVKALRKDYGKKLEVKQLVQDVLFFTLPDHDVRLALLKVAETIASSTSEPLPGKMITLQTPIIETPAMLTPKIRLSMASSEIKSDSQGRPATFVLCPCNSKARHLLTRDHEGYGFPIVDDQPTPSGNTTPRIILNPNANGATTSKKKDKVPKPQQRGLSDSDFKAIAIALKKLTAHKMSHFFLQPVDPVRDGAPDYTAIIKEPMDLATIRAKLDNGMYTSRQDFVADVRLIISNCMTYNIAPTSPVRRSGEAFERFFNSLWSKTENTLSTSAKASQRVAQPEVPVPAVPVVPVVKPIPPSQPEATLPAPKAPAVKFKVKPPKSVTIDTSVVEHVPPMAPPPLPTATNKKPLPIISLTNAAQKSPERPPVPTFPAATPSAAPVAEKPSKKRKEPSKSRNELDDILGAEVDAMESDRPRSAGVEDLLDPQKPPPKKIKLPPPPRVKSPEKVAEKPSSVPSSVNIVPSAADTKPNIKKIKTKLAPSEKSEKSEKNDKSDKPKSLSDEPKPASELPKPPSDRPKQPSEKPKPPSEKPKPPSDKPRPPSDKPKPSSSKIHPSERVSASPAPSTSSSKSKPTLAPTSNAQSMLPYAPPIWPQPPADLPPTVQNTAPMKYKRAKTMLAVLQKEPAAIIFARPVNPELDGCPTYLDEIKHPMDFGTIGKKLDSKRYKTLGHFAKDIELVFANCRQFNPPGEITACADAVEAVYWREWPRVTAAKMTNDEKKAMVALVNQAIKNPLSEWFRVAVDPIALGIPQYFDIIPREDARDLGLIKSKLDKGQYREARHIDDDVELMLENARVFNGDGPVVDAANKFGAWWNAQRSKMD
ncbi:transcription initiation factor TFIID subunit 2 [Kwoniella heveanensis BCC8398]|uniref:Transcription initiation factor TFIID subunit 2 n=1 Tax=Kwoniella heveanensis BCC8398 TaxID=1296120 RepID=A0A1B9GW37_9TREE|nr:transcription initiation factor TFIID subunit 2 [Kwoniella heveanensis BCC8398]